MHLWRRVVVIRLLDPSLTHHLPALSQLVEVFRAARREWLQFSLDLHDDDEDRTFLSQVVLKQNEVWVAEFEDRIVGFIAFASGFVNQLYVAPGFQGRGIGTRLLAVAQQTASSLQLWTFEANLPAIQFYQKRGFAVAQRTDGAGNEAARPDVRMYWSPFPTDRQQIAGLNPIQSYDSPIIDGGGVRLNRLAQPGQ